MDGYIMRCVGKDGKFFTLGKGFQSTDSMFINDSAFMSLTWRTQEEVKRACEIYEKRSEGYDMPMTCVPIYVWYSGKNLNGEASIDE